MGSSDGFPDEPTFNLAALAGHELTQQRLFAAQNLLVKREAEITELRRTIRALGDARERDLGAGGCTRCNGSGSEPDTDPDEAAGLVLVAREDVKWALSAIACYMPLGMVDEEQQATLARLRDASGASQ